MSSVFAQPPLADRPKASFLRSMVRRARCRARNETARIFRRLTRAAERLAPPVGRRMRRWAWIWQPSFGHRWLNDFYAGKVDPYHFEGNPYEAGKYAHTLRLLEGRTFGRALEIGCAEGVFTELLAPRCGELLAIDVAEAAVARARVRLVGHRNVKVVQAALPMHMPAGQFDLIVASDVLYYFPRDVLVEVLERLESALAPDGVLLALHFRGGPEQRIRGDEVHDLMRHRLPFVPRVDETVSNVGPQGAGYIVTEFQKPAAAVRHAGIAD